MTRAPFIRSATARGVRALVARLRRSVRAQADRQRLNELLAQVCALRAAGGCTPAQFDQAAALFAAGTLNVASQGAL